MPVRSVAIRAYCRPACAPDAAGRASRRSRRSSTPDSSRTRWTAALPLITRSSKPSRAAIAESARMKRTPLESMKVSPRRSSVTDSHAPLDEPQRGLTLGGSCEVKLFEERDDPATSAVGHLASEPVWDSSESLLDRSLDSWAAPRSPQSSQASATAAVNIGGRQPRGKPPGFGSPSPFCAAHGASLGGPLTGPRCFPNPSHAPLNERQYGLVRSTPRASAPRPLPARRQSAESGLQGPRRPRARRSAPSPSRRRREENLQPRPSSRSRGPARSPEPVERCSSSRDGRPGTRRTACARRQARAGYVAVRTTSSTAA